MTAEERQTVIDALNLAVLGSTTPRQLLICRQALAIIGREDKRQPDAWQWLNTGNFRKKLPPTAERSHWNPLYKD